MLKCDRMWNLCTEREAEVGPSSSGQSFGATATSAAVTGLYAGLKLTGFALRVATDLATSVTKEAERNRIRSTALKAEKVGFSTIKARPAP